MTNEAVVTIIPAPGQSAPSLTGAGETSPDQLSDGQGSPGSRSADSPKSVQSDGGQQSRCRYRRRDGSPCRSFVTYPDGGCIAHSQDPAALDSRRQGSSRGGRNRSNISRAVALIRSGPYRPIADTLARAIAETYSGELDPSRGHALAALARSIVLVADAANVDERLAELEEQIAAFKSGGETFSPPLSKPAEVTECPD